MERQRCLALVFALGGHVAHAHHGHHGHHGELQAFALVQGNHLDAVLAAGSNCPVFQF